MGIEFCPGMFVFSQGLDRVVRLDKSLHGILTANLLNTSCVDYTYMSKARATQGVV